MIRLLSKSTLTALRIGTTRISVAIDRTPLISPPPANTVLPAISGTAHVGSTLSVSTGTWDHSPTSYSYQWNRDGSPISGATANTYLLVSGDNTHTITCTVSAANASGVRSATSAGVAVTLAPPVNTVLPAVSGGEIVGDTLSTTNGTWSNSPASYAYQWKRDGVAISGATASTYVSGSSDNGHTVTCTVTATNNGGSASATSAGVALLPTGALGIWYANQVVTQTGGRAYVPNALSNASPSPSLFGAPRRRYGSALGNDFWQRASLTVTDGAGTSQDGISGDASRYNGTGDSYIQKVLSLAAGTYTMAAWVKSNTGSSQDFRMRFYTDSQSSTKTATTSWQRFTFTATITANANYLLLPIGSKDGTTALDLLFHDVELFAGSADLGVSPNSHLYLGTNLGGKVPTYASGALDFSANSGSVGYIEFPTATAGSQWTALAIGSKVAAGGAYQAFLSHMPDYTKFSAMFEQGTNNASYLTVSNYPGYINHLNTGFHGFVRRYDGTQFSNFIGDVRIFNKVAAFSSVSLQDLWVGVVNNTAFLSGYKIAAIALYNRALSDAEVAQAYAALAAHATSAGVTMADSSLRYVVAEGDSITAGLGATAGYPVIFGPNASPAAIVANNAVGSATLSGNSGNSLDSRKTVNKAVIPANPGSRTFIYTALIGYNDFTAWSSNPSGYAAAIGAHMLEMKQAGFTKTALGTLLPSTTSGYNAWRNAVNAVITAAGFTTTYQIDALIRFDLNATMGPDAAASDTSLYYDHVHPSTAGQTALEPAYRAVVNAL